MLKKESNKADKLFTLATKSYKNRDYQKAIEGFRRALLLKEDPYTYLNLGISLFKTLQFSKSVDAFRKSIEYKESAVLYEAYKYLAWALFKCGQYQEAIEIFFKSIEYKEDWNSYLGIGWSQLKTNKFEDAINSLQKSLTLIETKSKSAEVYKNIATAYAHKGDFNSSIYNWEKHFSCKESFISIDPFLGNGGIYEKVTRSQLTELTRNISKTKFDFIPSHKLINDQSIDSWEYLLYLSIPKCSSHRFIRPLHLVKKALINAQNKFPNLLKTYRYLKTDDLVPESNNLFSQVSALTNIISESSNNELSSLCLSVNGGMAKELHQKISSELNRKIPIISILRNPRERLLSDIKMLSLRCNSLEEMISKINENSFLYDNIMYRTINKFQQEVGQTLIQNNTNKDGWKLIDDIDFIDISDSATISKVKSAFLSSSLLPNIVQYSRLNDSKDRESTKVNNEEIESAFKLCLDKGFLKKDELIDYNFLTNKTKEQLKLPSFDSGDFNMIHPLTFLVGKNENCLFAPTKKFLKDPQYFLDKIIVE